MHEMIKQVVTINHQGRQIYGVSYMPKQVEKCPIVIFSHGYNGTHADFAVNSEYLATQGIGSYCFDFCGGSVHSKSDLKTTEMTIFTEKEDLCAVIDNIKTWDQVNEQQIFLFGGSQGGLVSALAADERLNDIKGLLLLFPALGIAENWTKRYSTLESIPDTHELWGMTLGRAFFESIHGYDVFSHIGKFDKQVVIFHGDQDDIVSIHYAKKASELYANATFEVFPGEGHGFSEAGNMRVAEMTVDFVKASI